MRMIVIATLFLAGCQTVPTGSQPKEAQTNPKSEKCVMAVTGRHPSDPRIVQVFLTCKPYVEAET